MTFTQKQLNMLKGMKCPWKGTTIPPKDLEAKCLELLNVKRPRAGSKRSQIREKIVEYMDGKIGFPFTKAEVETFFFTSDAIMFAAGREKKKKEEEQK